LKINDFLNSIIDLVSIGTIADIMPVSDENRIILYHGIALLNKTNHPGLSLLAKKISGNISAKEIAWNISPLLNTPGRFGKTQLVADFFLENNNNNLIEIIDEISKMNEKRKSMLSDLMSILTDEIGENKHPLINDIIFIKSEKVPEGLCGLLANRIADLFNKPVIIISLYKQGEIVKGSGRTNLNFNFFSLVTPFTGLFEKIGGHPQAFGFTVRLENIDQIMGKLMNNTSGYLYKDADISIDLTLPINVINYEFINNLEILQPFGHKNEECLFLTKNVLINEFKRFGKDMNHGKYFFMDNNIEAVGWNMADLMEGYLHKKEIDLIYRLENNYYNGFITPRMMIVDID
jgi:single-stranded-DNA-specific exonuclease